MHDLQNKRSVFGSEGERKRTSASRRLRETLFFRMLTEGEPSMAERSADATSALVSSLVPAWLSVALSS